jgi:hypothetical protein
MQGETMAGRPNKRASTASRRERQRLRGIKPRADASTTLIALARAWLVTTVACTLLLVALAIAPMWDRTIFMQALREALSTDPQLTQPADEATADPRQAAVSLGRP